MARWPRSGPPSGELASARAVLAAAGITADLPHAVDDLAPQYHEPFAYVLREAITNVVRHSDAGRCEVRLGAVLAGGPRRWQRRVG